MTWHQLLTRRMAVADLGRAGLAVMVFGVAACSPEDSSSSTTAGFGSTSEPGQPSTTGAPNTTAVPATSSTSQPPTFTDATSFERVDLDFVSAYILYRDGEAALVDTGVSNSEGAIEAALTAIGLNWGAVGHLILTHKHPDHQGSAEAVIGLAPGAAVYAGAGDLGAIQTSVTPNVIGDGDRVFDLDIIETPGHTAGSVSVLDTASGILVVGDAMNGAGSGVPGSGTGLGGANPQFSEDMDAARDSIRKLAGFEYRTILFGHGEPVLENGSQLVRDFVAALPAA